MHTLRTVRIDGKAFVCGLDWMSPTVIRKEDGVRHILEQGKQQEANVLALFQSQIGFGYTEKKRGLQSLAATLRSEERQLLCLFLLEDSTGQSFWWLFARIEDQNACGWCDRFFSTEQEAKHCLKTLQLLLPDSLRPQIFSSVSDSLAFLSPLLKNKGIREKLQKRGRVLPLSSYADISTDLIRFLLIGLCLSFLLYQGGSFVFHELDKAGLTPSAQRKIKEKAARLKEYETHPEKFFNAGWQKGLSLTSATDTTMEAFQNVPMVLSAWTFSSCEATVKGEAISLASRYTASALAAYTNLPTNFTVNTSRPTEAFLREEHKCEKGKICSWKELPKKEKVRALMLQCAQTLHASMTLRFAKAEKKRDPLIGTRNAPWVVGKWTLGKLPSQFTHEKSLSEIARLNGCIVTSIRYEKGHWTLKGLSYAR